MPVSTLQEPRLLERKADRSRFQSGSAEINDWFHLHAWQNHRAGNARVIVTTPEPETLGFYARATGPLYRSKLPDTLKPAPRICGCRSGGTSSRCVRLRGVRPVRRRAPVRSQSTR